MGRKRARAKTPAKINVAARAEAPTHEGEEEEEEDASTRTPSAKRKARPGERRTLNDDENSKEPDVACMGEVDSACAVDLGISIGGSSAEFVDKVASRLPGRRAQVATLIRLLDEVRTYLHIYCMLRPDETPFIPSSPFPPSPRLLSSYHFYSSLSLMSPSLPLFLSLSFPDSSSSLPSPPFLTAGLSLLPLPLCLWAQWSREDCDNTSCH